MSDSNALFPVVRDDIDFETLLAQAMQSLKTYSGQYWTDMAEHDPGITLLEAQAYDVADLAYRQTRALTDLLTPEQPSAYDGLFPPEFGPHQALTCGPITEDDYRRALLDLRSSDTEDGDFLFLNAQLIREPDSERYTYWYNTENREYSFTQPPGDEGPVSITLQGNYHLYLVPSRETLLTTQATGRAQKILDTFLLNNRNLGESVSRIVWLTPEDLNLHLVVDLDDDIGTNSNIAAILADLYQVAENYVTPAVQHVSTEQLQREGVRSEDIHQGPWLQYGWIPQLPPPIAGTESATVNLSGLVSALQNVPGVKGIRHLEALTDNSASSRWQWVAGEAGVYPRLWGSEPLRLLAEGEMVKLLASGDVQLTATRTEIAAELEVPVLVHSLPAVLPAGRWRNPGRYYPATDLVPPCYHLRIPARSSQQTQLHQFLLASEQLLANGCQQLALLPALLAFRREGDVVWGQQWPFKDGSVSDAVHQTYRQALESFLEQRRHDREQELAITGFLLGYFNSLLAPAVFRQPADRFLASQQGFLSRHTELTYHRSSIQVDQVSSLQRRIAARLGLGGAEIFDDNTRPDQFPFYLVEHRSLMPGAPAARYDSPQTPVSVRVETIDKVEYLVMYAGRSFWDVTDLAAGQLIDISLGYGTPNVLTVRGQIVKWVNKEENSFGLDIAASAQLENQLDEILSTPPGELAWQNAAIWLEDMTYPLTYDSDQSGLGENEKRLLCSPFPVMVETGDEILLFRSASVTAFEQPDISLALVVSHVDRIKNTLVVQNDTTTPFPDEEVTTSWHWYFTTTRLSTADRFSFMGSVVFNQNLLQGLSADPYATEAWVRDIILAEIPSHTGMLIHWKPQWEFNAFATTYRKWIDGDSALGDVSYDLMYLLALGELPAEVTGIGSMYVATAAQRDVALSGDGWNEAYIEQEQLFRVPRVGTVTLTVVSDGAVANGVDTNSVTTLVRGAEGDLTAGVEVHFWVDNGATIHPKGVTDANGIVTMTLTSFTPGVCTVTASVNDVKGSAETTFVAPQALNATLAVNGHTFSVSDGFPGTGFTQATFQVRLTGDSSSDYIWSASQPWVSVDNDGNVTFIGEPTETTNSVRLLLVPKSGSGNSYEWTFTVKSWFMGGGEMAYTWSAAADFSASHPGYSQPTVQQLNGNASYGSGDRGTLGGLWSEWGALTSYNTNLSGNSVCWSSEVSSSDSHYIVDLSSGDVNTRPDTESGSAVCRKPF